MTDKPKDRSPSTEGGDTPTETVETLKRGRGSGKSNLCDNRNKSTDGQTTKPSTDSADTQIDRGAPHTELLSGCAQKTSREGGVSGHSEGVSLGHSEGVSPGHSFGADGKPITRSDAQMIGTALRHGYDIPEQILRAMPAMAVAMLTDPKGSNRSRVTAMKLILQMQRHGMEQVKTLFDIGMLDPHEEAVRVIRMPVAGPIDVEADDAGTEADDARPDD